MRLSHLALVLSLIAVGSVAGTVPNVVGEVAGGVFIVMAVYAVLLYRAEHAGRGASPVAETRNDNG